MCSARSKRESRARAQRRRLAGAAYAPATQLRCVGSASNRGQIIIDLIRDLQAGSQVARHLIHSVAFVIFEA